MKNPMKKNLLIILLIFCISLMLTACGSKPAESETAPGTSSGLSENVTASEASGESVEGAAPSPAQPADSVTAEAVSVEASPKSLVVYFSWSGNTRNVAEAIGQQTGSDMFELIPAISYSDDYNTVLDEARTEQRNNARPEITGVIENIADYDTIYVGFPNWWGDMPMILYSFFDSYDLSGKTVALFCTSGGSGLSGSVNEVKALEPESIVTTGLHIGSGAADNPDDAVARWLEEIGTLK